MARQFNAQTRPLLLPKQPQTLAGVTAVPVQQLQRIQQLLSGRSGPALGNLRTPQFVSMVQQVQVSGSTVQGTQIRPLAPTCFSVTCRVINPSLKKDVKVFMLRCIMRVHFSSVEQLKAEILKQLGNSIVAGDLDFDVGYMKGQTKVFFHSEDDLLEVWHSVEQGEACILWCDGLLLQAKRGSRRSTQDSSSDSDVETSGSKKKKKKMSALEEKNELIKHFIRKLQGKHQDKFTKIQYRLWAEMLDVGTHKSVDEAPAVPMFSWIKAGKPNQTTAPSHAFTEMASSIASAFSKTSTPTTTCKQSTSSASPGRLIELRSKYIQQLRELHSLLEGGALSEQEYAEQKEPILQQLKIMNSKH